MKTTIAVLAFAVISTIASDADAQVIFPSGPPPGMPSAVSPADAPAYVPPYSYSVAYQRSLPARIYVGYGDDLFPFYGRPYGKPTDAWSWSAMSSSPYGGTLARYYYPPVR
jgi:hypothetical protein